MIRAADQQPRNQNVDEVQDHLILEKGLNLID